MFGRKFENLVVIGREPEYPKLAGHKYWKVKCSCGRESLIYQGSLLNGDSTRCNNCSGVKDIKIGDVFGNLTVVGEKEKIKGKWRYKCSCSCGNPEAKMVSNNYLVGDYAKNKGCGKCTQFDLVGKKIGRLTILSFEGRYGKRRIAKYNAVCECGNKCLVSREGVLRGSSVSCGCLTSEKISKAKSHDLTGQKFGYLEVLKRNGSDAKNNAVFTVKCHNCGNIRDIAGFIMKDGQQSCGCLKPTYTPQSHKTLMANNDKKYVGKKIGMVTVIKRDKTESGKQGYLCRCDCGVEKTYNICWITKAFENGRNLNCGCGYRAEYLEKLKKEYVGKTFNRLTIKDIYMGQGKGGKSRAVVITDCSCSGEKSKNKESLLIDLKYGKVKSCGCLFEEQVGENHPNWNPDLTDEQRKENECRTGDPQYRKWRRAVLNRDKRCKVCYEKDKSLHSHHILPWSISEEKRFDVSNGITLCEDCHNLFHMTYGQTENSPEDLEEFKRMY